MISFLTKYAVVILVIFHLIGLVGISFIDVHMFANLTSLNLLLSALLMVICHRGGQAGFTKFVGFVVVLGYLVEVLGVKTGFPFGNYHYGLALGPKLFDVPLVIGVNWFLLVMGSGFLLNRFQANLWARVVLAALLMVLVDVAIEAVAPDLNYWYWQGGQVPVMNYVGWFMVALIMQFVFQKTVAADTNKLAIPYIVTVAVFFVFLNLTL